MALTRLRWSLSPWISRRLADRPEQKKKSKASTVRVGELDPISSLSNLFFVDGFSTFFWGVKLKSTNPTKPPCLEPTLGSRVGGLHPQHLNHWKGARHSYRLYTVCMVDTNISMHWYTLIPAKFFRIVYIMQCNAMQNESLWKMFCKF